MKFHVPGDIALNASGTDFVLISGTTLIVQRIKIGSQIYRGTWRYDRRKGRPWLQTFLIKAADLGVARTSYYQFLAGLDDVSQVESVDLTLNRETRTLTIAFRLRTTSGDVVDESIALVLE